MAVAVAAQGEPETRPGRPWRSGFALFRPRSPDAANPGDRGMAGALRCTADGRRGRPRRRAGERWVAGTTDIGKLPDEPAASPLLPFSLFTTPVRALPAAAGGPIPTAADSALSCSIGPEVGSQLRAAGGYLSAQYSRCSQKYRCRHVSQSTHQPSAILHVGG